LPKELLSIQARANRTAAAVDKFFAENQRPTVGKLIAFLGSPDYFSCQGIYSKTLGTSGCGQGGTMRFVLDDGCELYASTISYENIAWAVRFGSKGKPGRLLYK
jgi:hypothetical protein